MKRLYYDLHNHSCLSPCADNDNTPNNLAGMAHLSGIRVMALTDHNSCKNCAAFFTACEKYDIIPIAGMELTTSEDIHVVFLFYELDEAMRFDAYVQTKRVLIKNKPEIFGEQLILDADDNVIGKDEYLLSNATQISIEDVIRLREEFDCVCFPAHVDREANGIISILGTIPSRLGFGCVEFHDGEKIESYKKHYVSDGTMCIVDSDSHYLTDIRDYENYLELDTDEDDTAILRKRLLDLLR